MDITLFVNSLTLDEKKELFNELKTRFEKGETLQEFYERLLSEERKISNRMHNILKSTIKLYPDYANFPVSKILENEMAGYPNLMKVRGFGHNLFLEFKLLRDY